MQPKKQPKGQKVLTLKEPAQPVYHDDWQDFLHWVYCPDGPGKCKCEENNER